MQTLKQGVEERNLMAKWEELAGRWRERLATECGEQSEASRESIVRWLVGEDLQRFDVATVEQLAIASQAMDYRYRILRQRYLGVGEERSYRNLMQRLGGLPILRNKIRAWVALSRDRRRAVVDVLQEVIQELLNSDRYIQQQIAWVAQCTRDPHLRNALLLANVEEYCLRPIRNQPLLVHRFVNYLRRSERGGITHIPQGELVRLVSEEITPDEADAPVSLLDNQAIAEYEDNQRWEEQQALRAAVVEGFESYLLDNLGTEARDWLRLYLQGQSQEAIAVSLNLPVKQIYRLREKVTYHAIRVFALKAKPELVANWLQTSLQEHNLGLTPTQWQQFWENCTPQQQRLLEQLQAGKTLQAIATDLKLKTPQVMSEWSKLYLAAQALRSGQYL